MSVLYVKLQRMCLEKYVYISLGYNFDPYYIIMFIQRSL
jgi:hypothetical protein